MSSVRFLLACLCAMVAAIVLPASAQLGTDQPPYIIMTLEAETPNPAAGREVTVAFVSRPKPTWHGYWKNPGDAGIETSVAWTLPNGVTAGPLEYPVPQRLIIGGLMNYIYEGEFAQFATLSIPAGLAPGTRIPVAAKVDYLVCTDEICVPETANVSTVLTVGDGAIPADARARFDAWRAKMPKPLGSDATFEVVQAAGAQRMFRLAVPYPADASAIDPYFYPATGDVIDMAAPQSAARDGDMLVIETIAAEGTPERIEGVLAIGNGRGLSLGATPGTVAAVERGGGDFTWTAALLAFAGAILGGLILNVMPCVFPILSLKALSLAKSGASEAGARRDALAYTAGVVLVCVALGAVLLGLRAGGAAAGWAFQLQDPRVILFLLLLVTAIALNLAGLFEIATPGAVNKLSASGAGGSFMTGALAAFIATPCTGPFMGVALGAALVLPWPAALAVFAGLGLGLALPFLLLGFVPALRRRLPRPGPWMDTFRKALSVPMFLTALALAWVLGRQAGVDGMTIGIGAALLFALGLWWTGRRQERGANGAWVPAAALAAVSLVAAATVTRAPAQAMSPAMLGAEPFTEARLEELRAQGKPVFAYFTADWCVTCKVNEKAAIETDRVAKVFGEGGVAVLVGDWTDGNPELGRFIERHNRAGVPLYLWYAPGEQEPRVLPQVLTPGMLTGLVTT